MPDSAGFEEWAQLKREMLRQAALDLLGDLVAYHHHCGDLRQVRRYALWQLELDPLSEVAHRTLMRAFALGGQRSAALAQYDTCCRLLADQLDSEPELATTALYGQIKHGRLAHETGLLSLQASNDPTPPRVFHRVKPTSLTTRCQRTSPR